MNAGCRAVSIRQALSLAWCVLVLLCAALPSARAQTLDVLHQFNSYPDGAYLNGTTALGQDGNVYGVAGSGGDYGYGLVYRITPTGDYTVLYSFSGENDGGGPSILIAGKKNLFYGVAGGVIFQITPDGDLTPLHQIQDIISALILGTDGKLYGTTSIGANFDGSIFSLHTDGTGFTTLYNFASNQTDGYEPQSLIEGPDGRLYGVNQFGGPKYAGTVYTITRTGTHFQTLLAFNYQTVGGWPYDLIAGPKGMLYGVTYRGTNGANGMVFSLKTNGAGFNVLHDFSGADGALPNSLLMGVNGTLYGTTLVNTTPGAFGTVFNLQTDGSAFTLLHTFSDNDGVEPTSLIQAANGTLYGNTVTGGNGRGTIFTISPSGTFQSLYALAGSTDGANGADITAASDGNFYGVTTEGGIYNAGTVFKQTPGSPTVTLHSFNATTDGATPTSAPILARDGNLYGTVTQGGSGSGGLIYRLTPEGQLTILYTFGANGATPDGISPSGLVQGRDGRLYGTTVAGGAGGNGTIFSIHTNGQGYKILHAFTSASGQGAPYGPLLVGQDGNLYGTTSDLVNFNTPVDYGTIFKITPQGKLTTLYTLTDYTVAANPIGALLQGPDGTLYGACAFTGPNYSGFQAGNGSLFSAKPDGSALKNLYTFTGGNDGSLTLGGPAFLYPAFQHYLTLGSNGSLYGVAPFGYVNVGTLYSIGTDGSAFTVLYGFTGSVVDPQGYAPDAVAAASDGSLYGVTDTGGDYAIGTIFHFIP